MAHTGHVLLDLDLEWEVLASSPLSARRLAEWRTQHCCLADASDLAAVIASVRTASAVVSTEIVWALLDLATDDPLAARTVLQAIVPGLGGELGWLRRWARRTDLNLIDGGDADQLLVLAAMEAIRHAAGQRRPWPILSLLRRTHRVLQRETGAEESWHRATILAAAPTEPAALVPPDSPAVELASVLRDASERGAVSKSDAALVWLTRVGGYQPAELESTYAVSGECLRRRRHRAEARLTQWAAAG
jgi:hypothetical protein